MTQGARFATAFVRRWVRVYTAGLAPAVRDERRAEIESDLWENAHEPAPGRFPVAEIAVRSLLGVPADITWRMERAALGERTTRVFVAFFARFEAVAAWIGRTGIPALTSLLAWLYIGGGALLVLLAPFQAQGAAGFAFVGGWGILSGFAVRWGRRRVLQRPVAGFLAVLVGSLPLGLLLMVTVVAPLLAGSVVALEGRRAWRSGQSVRAKRRLQVGD